VITFLTSILLLNVALAIIVSAWDEVNNQNVDEEGLRENHDLVTSLKMFKGCKAMARLLFVYKDSDFLEVNKALKNEHPHEEVKHMEFQDLCKKATNDEQKGKEMASWFFNESGQIITQSMIDDIRISRNKVKKELPYLFQRVAAKRRASVDEVNVVDS